MKKEEKNILWFDELAIKDVAFVGGKNASLGEMYSNLSKKKVNVPKGFATTSKANRYFLSYNKIDDKLKSLFSKINYESIKSLEDTGKKARDLIIKGVFPKDLEEEIVFSYRQLCKEYGRNTDVAVRSSATAEDLPGASFAGQHETYLNVKGEKALLEAVKKCFASLFTNRAITYRNEKGFGQLDIALSVGVQKMVRSDMASSGIMFTLDTESGFSKVVLINSIYGVGEMIVQGKITPDEFYVFKPTLKEGYKSIISKKLGRKKRKYVYSAKGGLKETSVSKKDQDKFSITDKEVLTLAKWACLIEDHYQKPQDIEWAKDKKTGQLFIVQARPETIHAEVKKNTYKEYALKTTEPPILKGIAVGSRIGSGRVRVINDASKISEFKKGEILVTKMTDPDWTSIMRIASAIVTDEGGKTCHSAIISRELGIPCIVGTKEATKILKTGDIVTVDCANNGKIYKGDIPFTFKEYNLKEMPKISTKITLNIGTPEDAFSKSFLPSDGVGLAREEFIISNHIKIHPLALYHYEQIKKDLTKKEKDFIEDLTLGYANKRQYFVDKLAEGVSKIGSAFYPKKVIVRFSDFKTNEYKNLLGGRLFEGEEPNPMLGFRGACRYVDPTFQPAFKMECQAIKKAREVFGLDNIAVMVPFCRTVEEGAKVKDLIEKFGLKDSKLLIYVMCEIPSNVILAEKFLEVFDGMSIGSNDLTQLTLGLDRDNADIAYVGNENNPAVKKMIKKAIRLCKKHKKYCGICGQAPSDYPEFAKFLVENKIESISLNPDTVIQTILKLSKIK